MKKNPRPKAPHAPGAENPLVYVPPLVAAVARLSDQMAHSVPREFQRAWQLMPELVAKMSDGDQDAIFTALRDVSRLEEAEREAKRHQRFTRKPLVDGDRLDGMVVALCVLEDRDPDLATELVTPVMDGAFMTGVAFACYVLTNGGAR